MLEIGEEKKELKVNSLSKFLTKKDYTADNNSIVNAYHLLKSKENKSEIDLRFLKIYDLIRN